MARMLKRFLRRNAKRNRQTHDKIQQYRFYAHHWDHPKTYAAALLLIIGMLAAPIYTGLAVKQEGGGIIYGDSSSQAPMLQDFCTDTDDRDYVTKGSISARSQESLYSFEDSCAGSVLKEYYCNGGRMASELKKCANGCLEGRCVP